MNNTNDELESKLNIALELLQEHIDAWALSYHGDGDEGRAILALAHENTFEFLRNPTCRKIDKVVADDESYVLVHRSEVRPDCDIRLIRDELTEKATEQYCIVFCSKSDSASELDRECYPTYTAAKNRFDQCVSLRLDISDS